MANSESTGTPKRKKTNWRESLHSSKSDSTLPCGPSKRMKMLRCKKSLSSPAASQGNERVVKDCIKSIMYSFGDSRTPQEAALTAMTEIVCEQIRLAVELAGECCQRSSDLIEVKDIVSIYKNDIGLIHRIYKRLHARYQARKLQKAIEDEDLTETSDEGDKLMKEIRSVAKEINPECLFKAIDPQFEDPVTQERLLRLDSRTKGMDHNEYLEFHNARGISFVSTPFNKKALINLALSDTASRLSPTATELISFLAFEVVAKLTESAVKAKKPESGNKQVSDEALTRFVNKNPLNLSERQLALVKRRKLAKGGDALTSDDIKNTFENLLKVESPSNTASARKLI